MKKQTPRQPAPEGSLRRRRALFLACIPPWMTVRRYESNMDIPLDSVQIANVDTVASVRRQRLLRPYWLDRRRAQEAHHGSCCRQQAEERR